MRRDVFIDVESGECVYLDNPETSAALSDVSEQTDKQRASHVEPTRPVRRFLFHLCRRLFGETGRVATWTRGPFFSPWRVNLAPVGGPILPTTYNDRTAAISAEVSWLADHPETWVI